jgi:hypothetical protein
VVLFCLPPNPLGELVRPLVLRYTHPFFEQYWNVFAEPPRSDVYVLARAKSVVAGTVRVTPWVNLSDAVLRPLHAFPLSPVAELRNVVMNATVAVKDDRDLYKRKFSRKEIARLCNPLSRPLSLDILDRSALFLGADTLGDPRAIRDVQIAIVDHAYPRFTERFKPDDPARNNDVTTYPWAELTP